MIKNPKIFNEVKDGKDTIIMFKYTDEKQSVRYASVKKNSKKYLEIFKSKQSEPQTQSSDAKQMSGQINYKFKLTLKNLESGEEKIQHFTYPGTAGEKGSLVDLVKKAKKQVKYTVEQSQTVVESVELIGLYINQIPQNIEDISKIKMYGTILKYHNQGHDNSNYNGNCVPQTLMNLYNNPNETNKRKRIIRLTIQKIVDQLSSYTNPGSLLDIEPTRPTEYDGFTTEQVMHFCNLNRIRCYALDHKNYIFQKNVNNKHITFNRYLPPLVFSCQSSHMYLITDEEKRASIFNRKPNNWISDNESKIDDIPIIIDPNFDEIDFSTRQNVILTTEGEVERRFYEEIRAGNIYDGNVKVRDNVVIRYRKQSSYITFNSQAREVMEVIENLNKFEDNEIKFQNQTLHGLADYYYKNKFPHKYSHLSPEIDKHFNSELAKNPSFTEFWHKPTKKEMKDVQGYDMNKHYSSCLKECDFGWSVFKATDDAEIFLEDDEITTGFYYVETNNYFPLRGNGIYADELVKYCLDEGIITKQMIKYKFIPSETLDRLHFQNFVNDIFQKFGNHAKFAINGFIGLLRKNYKSQNRHYFTTDKQVAENEFLVNDDAVVRPIFKSAFPEVSESDVDMTVEEFYNKQDENDVLCYHIDASKKAKEPFSNLPIHMKIYDMSALKCYKLSKLVGGKLIGIHTDSVYAIGGNKLKTSLEIGGIREVAKPDFRVIKIKKQYPREGVLDVKCSRWIETDQNQTTNQLIESGLLVIGKAGTGKSTLCSKMQDELSDRNIKFRCCAPTHKAALHINANTIHNLFSINPTTNSVCEKACRNLQNESVKYIFIDEVSMVSSALWGVIARIKREYGFIFVGFGDSNQLPPVLEESKDHLNSDVVKFIFDNRRCELHKIHRTDDPLLLDQLDKVIEGQKIDKSKFGKRKCLLSLCWSNACVDAINKKNNEMYAKVYDHQELEGKKGKFFLYKTLPVIANKTTDDYCNNENFTVQSFNDETVTIANDYTNNLKINMANFIDNFNLCYAMTVHKSQGMTINDSFTIYESDRMSKKMLYTAMSRATHSKHINFSNIKISMFTGFIYKYTSKSSGRCYIGSTNNIKRRKQDHSESLDDDKFHTALRKNPDDFIFEIISKKRYADDKSLKKDELKMIEKYNSVKFGFNSLNSIAMKHFL